MLKNYTPLGYTSFINKFLRRETIMYIDDEQLVIQNHMGKLSHKAEMKCYSNDSNDFLLNLLTFHSKDRDHILDDVMPKVDRAMLLKHYDYTAYKEEFWKTLLLEMGYEPDTEDTSNEE